MTDNKYDQPANVTKRLRYFDGQFLTDDDFINEQWYHNDARDRHHRALHVSGIADGLVVTANPGGLAITVASGTAVDGQGRQIILVDPRVILMPVEVTPTMFVEMVFQEEATDPSGPASAITANTRFEQRPNIEISAARRTDRLLLAELTVVTASNSQDFRKVSAVSTVNVAYSGVRLPGPPGFGGPSGVALRARGDGQAAELSNNLAVTGRLTSGSVGIGYGLAAQTAALAVNGNVGIGTASPTAALDVRGAVTIGTTTANQPLTVNGAATITGNTYISGQLGVNYSGTPPQPGYRMVVAGNTVVWGTIHTPVDALIGGDTTVGKRLTVTGQATLNGGVDITGTARVNAVPIATTGANTFTAGQIINNGPLSILNGTLGVGTGAPLPENHRMVVSGHVHISGNTTILSALSVGGVATVGGLSVTGTSAFNGAVTVGTAAANQTVTVNGRATVTGNVGIGTTTPNQSLVVASGRVGIGYDTAAQTGALAVNGNVGINTSTPAQALVVATGRVAIGSNGAGQTAALSVTSGPVGIGTATPLQSLIVTGGVGINFNDGLQSAMLAVNGNVGIFTTRPRSALDTAAGVMTGGANDYVKAQFTLSGGVISWVSTEEGGGRLRWDGRIIAIGAEHGTTFSMGHCNIYMPAAGSTMTSTSDPLLSPLPAGEAARTVTAEGIFLRPWEALYAVHTPGGSHDAVSYRIRSNVTHFYAPSNWILLAVYNGDNQSIKLGTGVTLPIGTINYNASSPNLIVGGNGRVGIGTASPAAALDVAGNGNVVLSGTGRVGIGTASPAVTLDVRGGAAISGPLIASGGLTVPGGSVIIGGPGLQQPLVVHGSVTANQGLSVTGGAATIGTTGANQSLTVNGNFTATGLSRATGGLAVTGGDVTIGAPGVNQRLTLNGNAGVMGSAGIGTTTPRQLLEVTGGGTVVVTGSGRVGIGAVTPRTELDTGAGVMSGAANDYIKAQFALTGGGEVSWLEGTPGVFDGFGLLRWSNRFIAAAVERGTTFATGAVYIPFPVNTTLTATTDPFTSQLPPNESARSITGSGLPLKPGEALYVVHAPGGNQTAISFLIRNGLSNFHAPSNWIFIAFYNPDDNTIKLANGMTLPMGTANASAASPNPYAVTADESQLRIIRGAVSAQANVVAVTGYGFTARLRSTGVYEITFSRPFSSNPTVVCNSNGGSEVNVGYTTEITTSSFVLITYRLSIFNNALTWSGANLPASFIAVGLR